MAKFPDTGCKSTDFNDLAALVRTHQNVVPRTLELPECKRARDYCRDMFNDTCYLPQSPVPNRHTVTMPVNIGDFADSETSQRTTERVLRFESDEIANKDAGCDGVTFRKAEIPWEERDAVLL